MFTEDNQDQLFDAHNSQVIIVESHESPNIFPTTNDFTHQSGTNWGQGYNLDSNIELFSRSSELKINDDIPGESLTGNESITDTSDFLGSNHIQRTETFNLEGITKPVVIDRDQYGIPHIQANNFHDGIFAQGFVEAQDRLWQMEYRRRFANGNLAEILGEDGVEMDKSIRTLGIDDAAQIAYDRLSSEAKAIVDAYSHGVNAYLVNAVDLPPEFNKLGYQPEYWQPTDTMAIAQLQNYLVGTTDGRELTRIELLYKGIAPERIEELLPDYEEGDTTILKRADIEQQEFEVEPPDTETTNQNEIVEIEIIDDLISLFPSMEASNSWVVSGDRTTTGKPFLANDPHLNLENPSTWYQTEINTPELQVIGASLPGLPSIQIGRNDNIAWGQTATLVDTADYYLLSETPDGEGYLYQEEIKPYEIRAETIEVKDGETITFEVKESIYGSVVSDIFGIEQPLALKSLGLEPVNGLVESFFGINQASNWEEFTSSLESVVNPINNFVYADIEGNIGYITPGLYPIRQPGHTGKYPVLGTGEFDWQGFIPNEDIPQIYNPESGYIVTANNKLTPDNYPYAINGSFVDPYRAERITELIESKDKLSLGDMQAIQFDRVSLLYRDFKPLLAQLEPISKLAEEWQEKLLDWDGNLLPDSQEASVFEAWYRELTRIPSAEVGQEFWDQPRYLQQIVTAEQSAIALEAALNRFGEDIPAWGDIHQTTFRPPVPEISTTELLQVPLGGDRYTVNVSPNSPEDFDTSFGVSYRQIIDFSNLENSLYINPPGQSGDVNNPNYSNQLSLWQNGEYIPMQTENYEVTVRSLLKPLPCFPDLQFGTIDGDILEITSDHQLVFTGSGNDLVDATFSNGENRIYAGNGDDTIILGKSDRIIGGSGADRFFAFSGGNNRISGGSGADQFWLAVAQIPDSANVITDFDLFEDLVVIAGLGIDFDDLIFIQQEDDLLIRAKGKEIAILNGITINSLSPDNFIFA